jgi:hypothetical protein
MHSMNTRVYVLHVFPSTIEVIWTLGVEPRDSQTAEFTCTVEARMPAPLRFIASLGLLPLFLGWHVQEETPLFAADIARKVSEGSQPKQMSGIVRRTSTGDVRFVSFADIEVCIINVCFAAPGAVSSTGASRVEKWRWTLAVAQRFDPTQACFAIL